MTCTEEAVWGLESGHRPIGGKRLWRREFGGRNHRFFEEETGVCKGKWDIVRFGFLRD